MLGPVFEKSNSSSAALKATVDRQSVEDGRERKLHAICSAGVKGDAVGNRVGASVDADGSDGDSIELLPERLKRATGMAIATMTAQTNKAIMAR